MFPCVATRRSPHRRLISSIPAENHSGWNGGLVVPEITGLSRKLGVEEVHALESRLAASWHGSPMAVLRLRIDLVGFMCEKFCRER
ncbi:hypothetical protein TRIP_B200162 [uncultured Desulfatiglans sp.]|uniref:Uncharacterized protein n=1 Tax=Uncultured Desulfatiglans sp. TaxID=1748965 RepID=A0A653A2Z2_UNCDX|nr:hypothetical protein TRIP_B200162 [uncultured Desulfatiglans sp.]